MRFLSKFTMFLILGVFSLSIVFGQDAIAISPDIELTGIQPFHSTFDSPLLVEGKYFKIKIDLDSQFSEDVLVPIKFQKLEKIDDDNFFTKETITKTVNVNPGANTIFFPENSFSLIDNNKICFKVTVDPEGTLEENQSNNELQVCETIQDTRQLRVWFVPIVFSDHDTQAARTVTNCDDMKRFADTRMQFLTAMFPIAEEGDRKAVSIVSCSTIFLADMETSANDESLVISQLNSMAWNMGTDVPHYDVVVGVVMTLEGGTAVAGKSHAAEGCQVFGFGGGVGYPSCSHGVLAVMGLSSRSVSHEISHALGWVNGLLADSGGHVNNFPAPGYWVTKNCDVGIMLFPPSNPDGECVTGAETFDLMAASPSDIPEGGFYWISGPTWEHLAGVLKKPIDIIQTSALNEIDNQYIGLLGIIKEDNTTELIPWFKGEGQPEVPLDNPGKIRIKYLDVNQNLIAETGFENFLFLTHSESNSKILSVKVPDVIDTHKIVVTDNETVFFERTFSSSIPSVTIHTPNGGEQFEQGGRIQVEWEGSDADADPLTYTVFLSNDDGKLWIPISGFITAEKLTFDVPPNLISNQNKIRVVVTDGVNTASDESDFSFNVVDNLDLPEGLHVSAANLQFDKYFAGPQIIEVIVVDNNIISTNEPHGEPDVTINGDELRMVQATNGYWHGFFADKEQALIADSTTTVDGIGLDFGVFCGRNSGNILSGDSGNYNVDISDTEGIAISDPFDVSSGVQGINPPQNLNNNCGKTDNDSIVNNLMNVLSKPRQVNELIPGTAEAVGQIGIDKDFWPFVQLYNFIPTGQVQVKWSNGGGSVVETLIFDGVGSYVDTDLDSVSFPRDAQVHFEITDPQLNIDPTAPDSWSFGTAGSSTLYRVFDEFGNPNGDGTAAGSFDIQPDLADMMFEDNGILLLNPDSVPVGTNVLLIQDNGDDDILCADKQDLLNCFTAGGTLGAGTQPVTIVETGPSTGVFRSFDNSLISSLKITSDAVRGSAAVIDYNETPATVLVDFENGNLQIHPIDGTWNSGEEIAVTLTDFDANKNTRKKDKLSVIDPDLKDMPAIKTGSPFSLASSSDVTVSLIGPSVFSSFSAQGNLAVVEDMTDKQDLLVFEGEVPSSWGGVVFDFGNSVMYSDLLDSINNPINIEAGGTTFHGENLFNFDARSTCKQDLLGQCPSQLHFYVLANNDGSPIIQGNGNISANQVIFLTETSELKGLNLLSSNHPGDFSTSQSLHDSLFNGPIIDNARIGLAVCVGEITESGCQGIPTNNQSAKFATIADFFSFGFNDDGMSAGDRIANQIIRLELRENATNSDDFEGSLEPLMINQLNVLDENTYKNLNPLDDEATFIVFDTMTDEDAPRIIYLDLNSVGTISQLHATEDVPTHTGVLQIDEFSYKIGDTVQVSVIDPDLSVDSDLINIYTVVPPNETSSEDPAGETIGKAGFPELSFGPLGTMVSVEFVTDGKWASPFADIDGVPGPDCTPITGNNGLFSTGFTLIETGAGSGIFQGDFPMPDVYCSRAEDGIKEVFDGAQIKLSYLDFRAADGEIVTLTTSADINAVEIAKLKALDATDDEGNFLGQHLDIYGDTLIVGVPTDDDHGFDSGSAYVFSRNAEGDGNWGQVKKLFPPDGSLTQGIFGQSVAIFDDIIVVGEPFDNEVTSASGAVHVFSRNEGGNNNWGAIKKLLPNNNSDGIQIFGSAVSIWEDFIMVGAPGELIGDDFQTGSVYVFARNQDSPDNWGMAKKILNNELDDINFGKELHVQDDTLVVVSDRAERVMISQLDLLPSIVYVFSKDHDEPNNWGLVKGVHSSDQDLADDFGSDIAIWGDNMVVGAKSADTSQGDTGAAYVFSRNQGGSDNWGEVKKLIASDGGIASDKKELFGDSVDILGDKIVIGSPFWANFPAEDFTGSAYVYSQNIEVENNWGEVQKLEASDFLDDLGFRYGDSVGITGGVIAIGAAQDEPQLARGAVYVYEYGSHSDADGIPDAGDNCPQIDNINQSDLDGDFKGNPCDNYNLITKDTLVSEDQTSIGDVFVTSGKVLTIQDEITLTIMGPIGLVIQNQPLGGVLIEHGGTLKILKLTLPISSNVMIAEGSGSPGCENTNSCYIPFNTEIAHGGQVTWNNDDSAAHTVTSGNPFDGPDGFFDSVLILAGNDFIVDFEGLPAGEYPYYCQLHPWQQGLVNVG